MQDGFCAEPAMEMKDPRDISRLKNAAPEMQAQGHKEDWTVKISISGYGKGESARKFSGEKMVVQGREAFIEDEGFKTEYKNSEEGMRQNFIVKNKPAGEGNLKIALRIDSKLCVITTPEGISFRDNRNNEKMKYNDLKAFDSSGKVLKASFEKGCSNEVLITVCDADAKYPVIIDPLSSTASQILDGEAANSGFGCSVSTAGDVNGDGYCDVIIGAEVYNSYTGRAYLYLGSASGLSASASQTFDGEAAGTWFGYSVSTAGDVNGDGYSDVIVGTFLLSRTELYLGSPSGLPAYPSQPMDGPISSYFGCSVSTAGDVNGDGYSDVIIGAYAYNSYTGRAFLYLGTSSGLTIFASQTFDGETANSHFGYSVSTAGDVNGDGYSDVIVGAYGYNSETGRAYLYSGSSSGLTASASQTLDGEANSGFGRSVSTAGDINGDGYSDVIIGANFYSSYKGRAYLYPGSSAGLSATASQTFDGSSHTYFGGSVSTAGDVNGDGYSDVIVGEFAYNSYTGRTYLYLGSSSGLFALASQTLNDEAAGSQFGYSVSTAGDVNGDGYSDVIVGAYYYSSYTGRAFLYLGSATGLSASASQTFNGDAGSYFGCSVSTAGDVNGDGYSDVIIGGEGYGSNRGRAYLYLGSSSGLSALASQTLNGEASGLYFGHSVSTAGDVNGDGYSDVIIGAYNYNSRIGRTYLYLGSSSGPSASASQTFNGDAGSYFGWSVSTAGDVNGDGYSDVIVGAYRNSSRTGRVYLYLGSSSGLSASASQTFNGETASSNFGHCVSTAGDVNGDGYSDVIVGAYAYSSNTGRAYLYLGSSSGLSASPSQTFDGDADSYFGYSVSTAGDVDGDGYSDVIIGAYGYSSSAGRVYLYKGNGGGTSITSGLIQQYQPSSSVIIGSNGKTNVDGSVRFSLFAKSPLGRAKGKLVYEYKPNGEPFSNNSSDWNTSASYTDLGSTLTGIKINEDATGITTFKNYRWRARIKYSPVSSPYQVYGPWRYYTSYQPLSFGSFKSQTSPLPVELNSFTASLTGGKIVLGWSTATEVNNYGFEIERVRGCEGVREREGDRVTGRLGEWVKIGFVAGNGNSNAVHKYSFVDEMPPSGNLLYRLKQVDNDGSSKYYDAVSVRVDAPKEFRLL